MPKPAGGVLSDGTHDLVALREYVKDNFAEVYRRAAIRFSERATKAEQIYDNVHGSGADSNTPRVS